MLNRRILRIKAFKTVYALVENPGMDVREALTQLEESCEATRDLYLFLLALTPPLADEARARIEAGKAKFHPTEEELHPKLKFAQNRVSALFAGDPDFVRITARKKLLWDQYDAFLWHLYDAVKAESWFKDYLDSEELSLKDDARLWSKVYENELEDNEELADILEEKSIWWNDDLGYALICCCKAMEDIAAGNQWRLPELYSNKAGKDSDSDFVKGIVRRAVADYSSDVEKISALTPKWDIARICATDLALIVTGMSEAAAFPDMDPRIVINEYVEISKSYSTPESKSFVNGLLDTLIGSGVAKTNV